MVKDFTKGNKYRHDFCLDIDIYVVFVLQTTNKYSDLKIIYLNRNYDNGNFVIDYTPENVRIFKKDFGKWNFIK